MKNKESKKWWSPFWSDLIDNPAHRKKMKTAIWLYLYFLNFADRKTGRLFRKRKTIASDMETTERTIGTWLKILRDGGYIETKFDGRKMFIQILNWESIVERGNSFLSARKSIIGEEGNNPTYQKGKNLPSKEESFLSKNTDDLAKVSFNKEKYFLPKQNITKKDIKESIKENNVIVSSSNMNVVFALEDRLWELGFANKNQKKILEFIHKWKEKDGLERLMQWLDTIEKKEDIANKPAYLREAMEKEWNPPIE